MICMTPTTASAPAIVGMLGGNVEFATVSSVLGNILLAALLPLLLTLLTTQPSAFDLHTFGLMLLRTLSVVILPLFLAVLLRQLPPSSPTLSPPAPSSPSTSGPSPSPSSAPLHRLPPRQPPAHARSSSPWPPSPWPSASCTSGSAAASAAANSPSKPANPSASATPSSPSGSPLALLHAPLIALGPTFYILWHNTINALQLWRAHAAPKPAPLDA